VYLYHLAIKPGLSKKFKKTWTGPYKVIAKLSELNYKIMNQGNKTQIIHVNRLKANYNPQIWKPKVKQKPTRKPPKKPHLAFESKRRERRRGSPSRKVSTGNRSSTPK
jgi:hypothetical protein